MKQLIRLILIVLLTVSCAPKSAESSLACEVTTLSALEKSETTANLEKVEKTDVIKKKIIKDGRLGIKVSNLKDSKINVDTLVKKLGGYYDKES